MGISRKMTKEDYLRIVENMRHEIVRQDDEIETQAKSIKGWSQSTMKYRDRYQAKCVEIFQLNAEIERLREGLKRLRSDDEFMDSERYSSNINWLIAEHNARSDYANKVLENAE